MIPPRSITGYQLSPLTGATAPLESKVTPGSIPHAHAWFRCWKRRGAAMASLPDQKTSSYFGRSFTPALSSFTVSLIRRTRSSGFFFVASIHAR